MTISPKYFYTFTASNGLKVRVLRGDGAPKMVGGGGGWELVKRPRRVSLTQWQGRDPYAMDVPVMFNSVGDDGNVETAISTLNQMQVGKDNVPPPTVEIEGGVPIKSAKWVITSIDWGDNVIWEATRSGKYVRLRQDAVVHLVQFVQEDRLARPRATAAPRKHVYRKGETLRGIAQKFYKDASKWKVIANANGIRDPSHIKDGTALKIP
jgi:hypothetical protein